MTIKELRELPAEELASEIEKARQKAWKMRFQAKGEPLENPGSLRKLRKDIARMFTVLREKELGARPDRGKSRLPRAKRARRRATSTTQVGG
jgi:large subunit ribosomal protein L29